MFPCFWTDKYTADAYSCSYDLPEDVFEPGEQRPTKAKKTKGTKTGAQPASKKRSLAEAKLDVREFGQPGMT